MEAAAREADAGTLDAAFAGRLRAAVALLLVSLGLAAFLLWPRAETGAIDEAEFSLLLVGPSLEHLETPVQGMGFAVESTSRADALPSLIEQARALGHGYLVLHPPHLYDYGPAVTVPDDANMAVVRVADGHVTFGGPAPGLASTGMSAELTGLVMALFEQPGYARLLEVGIPQEVDPMVDPMPAALRDLQEVGTLDQVRAIQRAHARLSGLDAQWSAALEKVPWMRPTTPLGRPSDSTRAFPLANGGVLLLVNEGRWTLSARTRVRLEHDAELRYLSPEALATETPRPDPACTNTFGSRVEGITINAAGDAVAVRRRLDERRWRVDAWTLTQGRCPFERLGLPERSGDARMMGLVSSDGVLWPLGSSGATPMLERDADLPIRRRAVAWAGPGLIVRTASFVRRGLPVDGVAFVEPDPFEPRAGFIPTDALLGRDVAGHVVQVDPIDERTFVLTTTECTALKLSFRTPIRSVLRPVVGGGDIPRRADIRRTAFDREWLVPMGAQRCGPVSFDRSAGRVVQGSRDGWFVRDMATGRGQALLEENDDQVHDVILTPDGRHAVAQIWLQVEGSEVLTSVWVTL